ncbi:hypothetical protein ACFYTF_29055 [Nocardia thailandica]|uniref:ATP-grasp domain-containing protein n=1 Tax=Nocardia thailandica TaxID=257275 RepID=A0ABW6PWS4_9NOCA
MEPKIEATVISWFNDPHADLVQGQLDIHENKWRWLRLGLDSSAYRFDGSLEDFSIEIEGELFTGEDLLDSPVLYMPFRVDRPPTVGGVRSEFSSREWESAFQSFLLAAERRSKHPWLMATNAIELQDRKLYLLATAAAVCNTLHVPRTHITSRLSKLPNDSVEYVLKALNMWQQISEHRYFNTTSADKSLLSTMVGSSLSSPVILQEKISHHRELRLYYSFGSVCGVELKSPDEGLEDFRLLSRYPGGTARMMEKRELEMVELEDDIHAISAALDISYFSADIAVATSGYWLFDINPIGSWEYLWGQFSIDVSPSIVNSYMEACFDY